MTTTNEDLDFDFSGSAGSDQAEEAFKQARGPSFRETEYFRLDASEAGIQSGANMAVIRFLTDHVARQYTDTNPPRPIINDAYDVPWMTVDTHSVMPVKPKPEDIGKDDFWPKTMGCVCRNDKIFKARYGDCGWCGGKYGKRDRPGPRTFAMCVMREEVREGNQVVGIRDMQKEMVKYDEKGEVVEGESVWVPDIRIINLGWKNFFSFIKGFGDRYGTVLDRDYHITRSGTGPNDTTYRPVPFDRIEMPGGGYYDLRDKALIQEKYPHMPDLRRVIARQASDEFYERYFEVGKPGKSKEQREREAKKDGSGGGQPTSGPAAPQAPASNEQANTGLLDTLRERVMSGGGAQQAEPAQQAAPAQEQAPATEATPQSEGEKQAEQQAAQPAESAASGGMKAL